MKISRSGNLFHLRAKHGLPFACLRIHGSRVTIFQSDHPLAWGELDLPVLGMTCDWHGLPLDPPLGFVIAADSSALWFVATRQASACSLPGAGPGAFTEGLWLGDVAELFLADPVGGAYLEFNLAPNGAWWAAKFTSPRVRSPQQPDFLTAVTSHRQETDGNGWCAALRVPLVLLQNEIDFGLRTTANATAILNTPVQTFHSAARLPGVEPDFHQPGHFPPLRPAST